MPLSQGDPELLDPGWTGHQDEGQLPRRVVNQRDAAAFHREQPDGRFENLLEHGLRLHRAHQQLIDLDETFHPQAGLFEWGVHSALDLSLK